MSHGFTFSMQHVVTEIVGMWFNLLPFRLSEVYPKKLSVISDKYAKKLGSKHAERATRGIKGTSQAQRGQPRYRGPTPPTDAEKTAYLKKLRPYETKIVRAHNARVKADAESPDSLVMFTGSSSTRGGICSEDTSLRGQYLALCRDLIIEESDLLESPHGASDLEYKQKTWAYNQQYGSDPRRLYTSHTSKREYMKASAFVHREDIPMVYANAIFDLTKAKLAKKSLNGLLNSLENVGHRAAPDVEGLNITLHEYQKQSVGFMLDRETKNSRDLLWCKLPPDRFNDSAIAGVKVCAHSRELWFSPILGMFSLNPPRPGKGGFMCEEMGMGKTVISLAIILQNPAPVMPPSGTPCPSSNNSFATEKGWSSLEPRPATDKTGSVFSRGTLVVCPVSLVGQWVEEAKNKLTDPGMVYPYHGGSRKRDPSILSQKDVVVTTYAVLASDNNYWRNKSKDPNYCAPCQKIR